MRTIVLGPLPAELEQLIARRRALGLDVQDEVWEGDYHMAPAAHASHGWLDQQLAELLGPMARSVGLIATGPFNLGRPDDFRVPDRGLHRSKAEGTWIATAAMVVEIESPDDETWAKLGFYASRGVDEILIVSPQARSVTWLVLEDDTYIAVPHSRLLGPLSASLAKHLDWPTTT